MGDGDSHSEYCGLAVFYTILEYIHGMFLGFFSM